MATTGRAAPAEPARALKMAAGSNGSNAAASRPQIAPALAVESCCDTTVAASPAKPSGRRRNGGRPACAISAPNRGSACVSAASAASRSFSVRIWVSMLDCCGRDGVPDVDLCFQCREACRRCTAASCVSHRARTDICIWAMPIPHCSTTTWRAILAAGCCCASRTSTSSAAVRNTRRRSTRICAGSAFRGQSRCGVRASISTITPRPLPNSKRRGCSIRVSRAAAN